MNAVETITTDTPDAVDWAGWARRWEAQQQFHVLHREQRFQVMLDVAEELLGAAPSRVLDLACGTGAISQRALARFPGCRVVALDADPLLLRIGAGAHGDAGGRLDWARADLRQPGWAEPLRPRAPFDAVLSSTALHWLGGADLARVYQTLAEIIRPGGVLLNADRLPVGPQARLAGATERLRKRQAEQAQAGQAAETYFQWWTAAEGDPLLADVMAERARVFEDHPSQIEGVAAPFHLDALAQAGFAEAAVVWRYLDYAIVAAVR